MIKCMMGDCLERMAEIEAGSVDLTVTSPPYDNLRTYNGSLTDWTQDKWKDVLRELFRVTKDGGTAVWVVADATVDGSETGTSFRQALFAMECGFKLHDTMIWKKPNFSNPSATRYHQTFEYMFVLSKGKPRTVNLIKDRKNICAGQTTFGRNTTRKPDGSFVENKKRVYSEFGARHNVWKMKTTGQEQEKSGHPAAFPLRLASDHVISWSNEGDVVFDPFMGSGTTGVACVNTGRNFIGIERDPQYYRISCQRIGVMP